MRSLPACLLFSVGLAAMAHLSAAPLPPGTFIDIDATNTAAVGGSPSPFYTDNQGDAGFTSGALWRRRAGFGFDAGGNRD